MTELIAIIGSAFIVFLAGLVAGYVLRDRQPPIDDEDVEEWEGDEIND